MEVEVEMCLQIEDFLIFWVIRKSDHEHWKFSLLIDVLMLHDIKSGHELRKISFDVVWFLPRT